MFNIFNKKKIEELQNTINLLTVDNAGLKMLVETQADKIGDPRYVVEKVMKKDIEFYDYTVLSEAEQLTYYNNAQAVLRNETLKNEINHMVADWVEYIAKDSKDFDEVGAIRMHISATSLLKERLSSIPKPGQTFKQTNLYTNI